MSSLSELPEIVGFFSYCREDDEAFNGALSALRDAIQRELSAQLGRNKRNFRLWQDQEAIAPGKLWESEITTAVEQAVFFIPIVTPRAVSSRYCKFEFSSFLARERALDRDDLIFPILYISIPALEDEAKWRIDSVLSIVGVRQYVDWRAFRHLPVNTPAVGEAIERFCSKVVEALREPRLSPEERREQEEIAARRDIKEKHRQLEADSKRLTEEEVRRKQSETEVQRGFAEEGRRKREYEELERVIGSSATSKVVSQTELNLEPGEILEFSGFANHFLNYEGRGGRLFLTDRRLAFQPHRLNVQRAVLSVPRSEIVGASKCMTFFGLYHKGLCVRQKDGTEQKFVVNQRDAWLNRLAPKSADQA